MSHVVETRRAFFFAAAFTGFLIAGCTGCLVLPLSAQLTRGFISGLVQDSAGAVIGDVKITITNKATGIKNQTSTNAVGVYRFVAVEPGTYDVEFSQPGFELKRIANVEVTATQEVTLN